MTSIVPRESYKCLKDSLFLRHEKYHTPLTAFPCNDQLQKHQAW